MSGLTGAKLGRYLRAASPGRERHDRIYDIRRLCDLFGLTPGGAERYTRPAGQPAGTATGSAVRTDC